MRYYILLAFCFCSLFAGAQPFQRFDYLPVYKNSTQLLYPWTGGLNSVQFGKADVNHDGKKDLVVYDKVNSKYCVFLTQSTNSTAYKFVNQYAAHFPPVSGWMILKDYNCDGIEDLFTYNGVANTKVYSGYYDHDTLNFKLQQDGLYYPGNINVYVSEVIKPAIVDVNGDGDLDIISYTVFGTRLIYYENQRIEMHLPCDSLFFTKVDNCWGNVRDTFTNSYALRDTCSFKFNKPSQIMHTGSLIDAYDADHNGAVDVLIGSVSLSTITMLYNKGTTAYASILLQDVNYPHYDTPYSTNSFASPAFVDADNDGNMDLLVSTYDVGAANINNMWFYKNLRSDSLKLSLQQKDFLIDQMIEGGENSNPCFMDVDGDGLKDILLGSGGFKDYAGTEEYKLQYFRNTGTADYPEFTLENGDFLNINALGVKDISPTAGDIDNDGDTDLLVGIQDGRILFWENTAGAGNPPNLVYRLFLKDSAGNNINIGANAAPTVFDINKDGKNDLIVGERNGNLNFYRGNDSSKYVFVTDSLGKVRIRNGANTLGFTQPSFAYVDGDNKIDMILGTNLNGLQFYSNIQDHITDSFARAPDITPSLGQRTTAAVLDITNDGKLELLTGSLDGGLIIFSQVPPTNIWTSVKNHMADPLQFNLYPNPADNTVFIQIENSKAVDLQLFNTLGQQLFHNNYKDGEQIELNIAHLSNGIYLLKVNDGEKEGMKKLVIQR